VERLGVREATDLQSALKSDLDGTRRSSACAAWYGSDVPTDATAWRMVALVDRGGAGHRIPPDPAPQEVWNPVAGSAVQPHEPGQHRHDVAVRGESSVRDPRLQLEELDDDPQGRGHLLERGPPVIWR
jgi:hypothetical protein